jgi:hypothetical protein
MMALALNLSTKRRYSHVQCFKEASVPNALASQILSGRCLRVAKSTKKGVKGESTGGFKKSKKWHGRKGDRIWKDNKREGKIDKIPMYCIKQEKKNNGTKRIRYKMYNEGYGSWEMNRK